MLSGNPNTERLALHDFSTAFLINFILGIILLPLSFLFIGIPVSPMHPTPPQGDFIYTFMFLFVITGVGFILYVYYLWHGFDLIENTIRDTSIGKIGSILTLFSLFTYPMIILLLGGVTGKLPPEMVPLVGVTAIMGIFIVISIVGFILVLIGLFRIGEHYESTAIKVGAILLVFLGFIGSIILFIGFKDLENNPVKGKTTILPPPPSW